MPVKRGRLNSDFSCNEQILRVIEHYPGKNFVIGNAQADGIPVIYCTKGICELTGYEKGDFVQKSCALEFLCGPETDPNSVSDVRKALQSGEKREICPVTYYKKNGTKFFCSVLITPVRGEAGEILMYVVSHEQLNEDEVKVRLSDNYQKRKKRKEEKKRKRKKVKMDIKPEEIALMEHVSDSCRSESRPANGHLRKSPVLQFTCPTPPEQRSLLQQSLNGNGSNLRRKISRSASHIEGYAENFEGQEGRSISPRNLSISPNTRKISSSDGDMVSSGNSQSSFVKSKQQSSAKRQSQSSIFESVFPSVPPLRQASINPGQKVVQVMSLGTDVLPEYKVESPKIHPWTILHYSPFKAVWDWLILILVMYTAIVTPYMAAFVLTKTAKKTVSSGGSHAAAIIYNDPLVIVDYIVDVMFIVDIFINFRTTFVNATEEVVSDPCRIAVHYVKGWFLIDLLAAIPFELLIMIGNTDQTTTLIGLLKTARLLRLVRVARKADRYSEYGMALLLLLMFGFALVAHWLACIWYAIGNIERSFLKMDGWLEILARDTKMPYNASNPFSGPDVKTKYITALYFTLSSLTSVGFGNISPNTNGEKLFTIVIMLVGALMYAVIFGNVTAIIQGLYSSMAQYHATMRRVREFLRFYQIPSQLRQRLEDYVQYDYSYTNGIDMNEVLKRFPEGLQADICLHLNRHLLSTNPLFRAASPGCLRTLSLKLKTTHCPPGDYIIHYGDEIKNMYWIGRGTVEVIQNDTITAILGKGDVFGENFSVTARKPIGKSKASIRALTYCDLHAIGREDALYIIRAYPDFRKNFADLQATFDLRDPELEQSDLDSSIYNIYESGRCHDVVFRSPEYLDRRTHYYPVTEVDINNEMDRNCDDSDSDDAYRRRLCSRDERGDEQHNTDCCNCNIELRRDIERLKCNVNRLDLSMRTYMGKIVSLLEKNSANSQSDGRKTGVSSTTYTSRDGNANSSV